MTDSARTSQTAREVLGVSETATAEEIEKTYLFLVVTYGQDSFAVYRAVEEETRLQLLQEIEEAYQQLCGGRSKTREIGAGGRRDPAALRPMPTSGESRPGLLKGMKSGLHSESQPAAPGEEESVSRSLAGMTIGETLRSVRKARGLSLQGVASSTRMNAQYLRALEEDRIDQLPAGSYRRLMLIAYARSLNLEPDGLLERLPDPESK